MQFGNPPLTVKVVGSTVLVSGEVDLSTAQTVEDALLECIAEGWQNPTVDLSEVTYFDSSGIQALLKAKAAMSDAQGPISIVGLNKHTSRVLRIVGLEKFFDIEPPTEPHAEALPYL